VAKPSPPVLGLATERRGAETWWSLLSRGDRVRGRIAKPSKAGRHPVIILAGPDGCASSPFAEAATAAWSARAAVVAFDLPLCGSRKSDKLTALALDPNLPLAKRLRAELEAQVAADLTQVLALIATDPDLDPARVTFAGVALGAELARTAASNPHPFHQVALAPSADPGASWLREVLDRAARA